MTIKTQTLYIVYVPTSKINVLGNTHTLSCFSTIVPSPHLARTLTTILYSQFVLVQYSSVWSVKTIVKNSANQIRRWDRTCCRRLVLLTTAGILLARNLRIFNKKCAISKNIFIGRLKEISVVIRIWLLIESFRWGKNLLIWEPSFEIMN